MMMSSYIPELNRGINLTGELGRIEPSYSAFNKQQLPVRGGPPSSSKQHHIVVLSEDCCVSSPLPHRSNNPCQSKQRVQILNEPLETHILDADQHAHKVQLWYS